MTGPRVFGLAVALLALARMPLARGEDRPAPGKPGEPGTILWECWPDLPGTNVSDLTGSPDFPAAPSECRYLSAFETPANIADNYGAKVSGFLHPPATGEYVFLVASDDSSELWLSPSERPADKVKLAFVNGCTGPHQYDAQPNQASKPVRLEAGRRYYIEALYKEGGGEDFLSVRWKRPDGKVEDPIPGACLSPAAARPVPPMTCAFVPPGPLPQRPGLHKLKVVTRDGRGSLEWPLLVYLPVNYDTTRERFPVVVFLHGGGEHGNDYGGLYPIGPNGRLDSDPNFRAQFPLICISPQCPGGRSWSEPWVERSVVAILDEVLKSFRADPDRVYLTGLSEGATACWKTALQAPDRWAAVVPLSGREHEPALAAAGLRQVAAWIIVGDADGDYTEGSRHMKQAFDAAGGCATLTLVPGMGHGGWEVYYQQPRFYKRLIRHRRNDPASLAESFEPTRPQAALPGGPPPVKLGVTGSIVCEVYRDIGGVNIPDLIQSPAFPYDPSEFAALEGFEAPPNLGENIGCCIRGYLHPAATGDYTFWITSDDAGELRLSPTEKPDAAAKLAWVDGCVNLMAWDQQPNQKSKPVRLEVGKKYYVEALMKQGGGPCHLAVGWQLPDGQQERPIPGARLSPAPPRPPPPVTVALEPAGPLPQKPGPHRLKAVLRDERTALELPFLLYLPLGYDTARTPFPMLFFLHGEGEKGNNYEGLFRFGPEGKLRDDPKFREAFPMICVSPQLPLGTVAFTSPQVLRFLPAFVEELVKQLHPDPDRISLTGMSEGGTGAWLLALKMPDRFAALAPIGAQEAFADYAAQQLKSVKVWIVCGDDDGGFTAGSKKMEAALRKGGVDVRAAYIPKRGHDIWTIYFQEPKFYEWLSQQRRGPPGAPAPVVAVASPPAPPEPNPPPQAKTPPAGEPRPSAPVASTPPPPQEKITPATEPKPPASVASGTTTGAPPPPDSPEAGRPVAGPPHPAPPGATPAAVAKETSASMPPVEAGASRPAATLPYVQLLLLVAAVFLGLTLYLLWEEARAAASRD